MTGSKVANNALIFVLVASCMTVFALISSANEAIAEDRLALLIGNSRYEYAVPLRNPENDVALVSTSLEAAGFEVFRALNVDKQNMRGAIDAFLEKARAADNPTVMVYFAGHGVQVGGRNFLLPVDAPIETQDAVRDGSFSADSILDEIADVGAALEIVVLDACRDNPFGEARRSLTQGLADMPDKRGRLLAFSTAPGTVATDGDSGSSPYASAFAEAVMVPGLSLRDTFDRVRSKVFDRTKGAQTPWEEVALFEPFYFIPDGDSLSLSELEEVTWDLAATVDSAEAYQRYLDRFPNGRFAAIARGKIEAINKDFSFRKQSETFPVLRMTALDFSGAERYGPMHKFYQLRAYHNQIIYLDVTIPVTALPNIDRAYSLKWLETGPTNCIEYTSLPIEEFFTGRHGTSCPSLAIDNGVLAEGQDYLFLSNGEINLAFPLVDASHFSAGFDPQEGQYDYAAYHMSGLVRVQFGQMEIYADATFTPVDPAEFGLTWKHQNTLNALTGDQQNSGLRFINLH